MAEPAPWDSDPVADNATASQGAVTPPVADQTATPAHADAPWVHDAPDSGTGQPSTQQSAPAAATAQAPVSVAPTPDQATKGAEAQGFKPDEQEQILAYIPKAKDAADLEQFSSQLTNGRARIGNAKDVLDKYAQGHRGFGWEKPTVDTSKPAQVDKPGIRDHIGQGLVGAIDALVPGFADLVATHRGDAKALTEHVANAAAGDYGPEVGGVLDTVTDPSQYGNFGSNMDRNVAHERAQLTGDSAGHGVASAVGELAGAGLTAPVGGEVADALGAAKAAEYAPTAVGAAKAGVGGMIYGSGAAGPGNRLEGAATGAALGSATDLAAPYVIKAVKAGGGAIAGALSRAPSEDAVNAARAAQDLNVDLPAFAVQGPAAQAKAAKLSRQGAFGAKGLGQSAQTALDQAQAARDATASSLAQPRDIDSSLGDDIKSAAIDTRGDNRARIGRMFNAGDAQMGDVPVKLQNTTKAISDLAGEDSNAIVPSPATPLLKQIQQRIKDVGGTMSAADLRASTQNLKALMRANSIDATTSDHVMGTVRDAMNADMETAAKTSGNESALQTYKDAREQWAASKMLDKTVLKPVLGAAFQNNGDQVVNSIRNAVKNNGTRVAQLFNSLPDDVANTARASLINNMGTDKTGAFDLKQLADNWNSLGGSRKLVFPPETVQAMDKLANGIGQFAKPLQTVAQNAAKAQPFGLKKLMTSGPAALGEAAFMWTHDVKDLALGTAVSAFNALGQWRSSKLLANTDFAKRLANMPMNPQAASAFWNRPWVNAMAAKNPAIAGEIQLFQRAVNDNLQRVSAAASVKAGGPTQNQKADSAKP